MISSPYSQNFTWEQKEKSVWNFRTFTVYYIHWFLNFQVQKAASGSESGDESSSDSGESDEEKKEKSNGEKPKEKSVSREPSAEKHQQEVMIGTPSHAVKAK